MRNHLENNLTLILLLLVISVACYLPSFRVPFYLDDISSITGQALIQQSLVDYLSFYWRRAVTYLTFWFDYQLWGESATGYHLINILLHSLTTVVVFGLLRKLIPASPWLALMLSLLWALHPFNSQPVIYIVQRATLLASFFALLSLLCWLKAREQNQQPLGPAKWYGLALGCYLLGILSKEFVLVLPLIWLLADIFLLKTPKQQLLKTYGLLCLAAGVILLGLMLRVDDLAAFIDANTRETIHYSRSDYLLLQFKIVAIYMAKFVIPYPLLLEYPVFAIPTIATALPWIFLHSGLVVAAIYCTRFSKLIIFGLLFYYVASLIESALIPIIDQAFEHRVYFANIGLIFILLGVLQSLQLRLKQAQLIILLSVILLCFSVVTVKRQLAWSDPLAFYTSQLKFSDNNPRLHYNIGFLYLNADNFEMAAYYFKNAYDKAELRGLKSVHYVDSYLKSLILFNKNEEADQLMNKNFGLFNASPAAQSKLLTTYSQIFVLRKMCVEARPLLQQAMQLDADNLQARELLEHCN